MKAQGLTRETIRELGVEKRDLTRFEIGDHIAISQWITEGNKKRIQVFEGDVIAMHHKGASSTFTVRKIGANSVSVERIFPFYCPIIDSIKIVRKGDVRRAKLYYLRDRVGKSAQVKEKILSKEARALMREKTKEAEAAKKAKQAAQVEVAPKKVVADAPKQEAKSAEKAVETKAPEQSVKEAPVEKTVEKKADAPKEAKVEKKAETSTEAPADKKESSDKE
jgi:large subunit ribosomal protein L19